MYEHDPADASPQGRAHVNCELLLCGVDATLSYSNSLLHLLCRKATRCYLCILIWVCSIIEVNKSAYEKELHGLQSA